MQAEASTFSYQTPAGGDVSIKSNNGDNFVVHSILLRLASSVFADTLSTASQSHTIDLTDDTESVSLMLRFIYPPAFMDILSISQFEKSLRMAQKYDIAGIITSIDHLLSHSSNLETLTHSDLIHAFCLAVDYGLPKTLQSTREFMQPGYFRYYDPRQIESLVKASSSGAVAVRMLGAHCVWTCSLIDLLLDPDENILPYADESDISESDIMMCIGCYE
ncbi:The BTB (BR-C, ttk and bab)/POZ (Pox virus and Zinc finger) domain [Ceratobasidium sp. AG-Ba]|nr:The BTB (BR-C, ttk and bab)/POZ (Pox virus and Zinc finger) domain [Ceratobasidium sp. AG-Ba]